MLTRMLHATVFSVALMGAVLQAQVDPRLQACTTDVLDIYQGGKTAAKPEIITLIDNSRSTKAVAWDKRYYTNSKLNTHLGAAIKLDGGNPKSLFDNNDPDDPGITPSVTNTAPPTTTPSLAISCTVELDGLTCLLIKPNGDPVTASDVGKNATQNDWALRASHIRVAITSNKASDNPSYTYNNVKYPIPVSNCRVTVAPYSYVNWTKTGVDIPTPDKTRVVDIPTPWAVFERVTEMETRTDCSNFLPFSTSGSPTGLTKSNGLPRLQYLYDPVPDKTQLPSNGAWTQQQYEAAHTSNAQYYDIDSTWWRLFGGNILQNDSTEKQEYRGFHYNPDYLMWCLLGQDTRSPNEDGGAVAYSGSGKYTVADVREGAAGFKPFTWNGTDMTGNGLPAMTRFQAIKYAIIKTWCTEQLNVWWAIRFLKMGNEDYRENGRSGAIDCFCSDNLKGKPGDRKLLRLYRPTNANNPDVNLGYIQNMEPTTSTPLTFALLNTYAQMASADNGSSGSVFQEDSDPYKGEKPIPSCRQSFVIILSDGAPNDDNANSLWGNGNALGSGDPFSSGTFSSISFGDIAPTKPYFNIWSLAGVAAHLDPKPNDIKTTWPRDIQSNNAVTPPFKITSRPSGTTRRISTMTIGVSMAGSRTGADAGPKAAMYKTALYGWEKRGSFTSTNLPLPFKKDTPDRDKPLMNPYFFDAQSPEDISSALKEALGEARSVTNVMSAPVAPLVGLGVGNQMYLGTFTSSNQILWQGDLLTVGMKVVGNNVTLYQKNGSEIENGVPIGPANAIWSAGTMLKDKGWKSRNLYTIQNTAGSLSLIPWNESTPTSSLTNGDLNITDTDPTLAKQKRLSLIRFMMGASQAAQDDTADSSSITTSRDEMMGDIINSTPAVLEFSVKDLTTSSNTTLSALKSWMMTKTTSTNKHFRLIIVGDNQGILHGFGEVSAVNSAGHLEAMVDELWGIIPPDFLKGLNAWRTTPKVPHRYLVDGSPVAYVNEAGIPNGIIDGTDFVRVIFGLRKGGRSYYTIHFADSEKKNHPETPQIAWTIQPDLSTDAAIKTMGFSTSTPALSRVIVDSKPKDVFFIGGGLSTTEVDTAFSAATTANPPGYGAGTKLGRSIFAFDVYDGKPVKKWDFINDTNLNTTFSDMGCVPAGPTPTEVLSGSYKTQAVYFSDMSGGVSVLGAKGTKRANASDSIQPRTETAAIASWGVRRLFKTQYGGTGISTSPITFPVPGGYPTTYDGKSPVACMGVAFGTGDRNDPMDRDAINPTTGKNNAFISNRFVMLLDRRDSADITGDPDAFGYQEDELCDLTNVTATTPTDPRIVPGSDTYYLKTKVGYRLEFETSAKALSYFKKMTTAPMVLNNCLFFTVFAPNTSTDPCVGAGGTSTTYRMNNVLAPVFSSGSVQATGTTSSGWVKQYNDIPSELANAGLGAVLQVGEVQVGATGTGNVAPTTMSTTKLSTMPRPRAWRIIR